MHSMIVITSLFPAILVGVLLPILGRTRPGLLFGVTVPLDFAQSTEARAAVRRYVIRTAALSLTVIIVMLVVFAIGEPTIPAPVMPLLSAIAIPIELLGGLALWQTERGRIKPHATVVPLSRTAELLPQRHIGGIYASIAALVPLALVGIYLHSRWNDIPARWPQHWDAYGHINGWGVRSTASVYFPIVMGSVIVLLITVIATFIAFAPGPQSKQRRLVLAPLAGLAWLMSGLFCVVSFLPLRQSVNVETIIVLAALHLLATIGIVIWLLVRSGMMDTTSPTAEPYDSTPDAMWRAGGLVYYNPGDAAVIVPKRYGFGWTLNMARPAAWYYIGGILLTAALIGAAPFLLHK